MPVAASRPADTPIPRSYSPPPDLRETVQALHETSPARSAAAAVGDHVAILVLIGLSLLAYRTFTLPVPVLVVGGGAVLVAVARFQRALECLVHEGSHWNWDRRSRRRNDLLATLLAGLPTISTVQQYRPDHFQHHRRLGTGDDPDLRRYRRFDIEAVDRSSARRLVLDVARRLPGYFVDWWRTIGTTWTTVLGAIAWHALAVFLPATSIAGSRWALAVVALWFVAFTLALPVLRFVGEAGEHEYTGATSVFDATMVNEGAVNRLLVYPHNDGYHLAHHLWPGVPHHRLRRLHELLLRHDPEGYGARVRGRTRLLQRPSAPAPAAGARRAGPHVA